MRAADVLPVRFNAAAHFVDRNVAEGRGAAPAFVLADRDRVLTCADVQELVNRTGNLLLELGVEPEHRVLVACLDTPEFLGAFWGAIKIGAIPIPVNTLLRTADYRYFLEDSRARVAVVSAPLLAEVGPALEAGTGSLRHVLVAGGPAGRWLSYEDGLARASATLAPAPTHRDEPAFWLYSSGSTGFPKGAVHLHHDMVVCAETYAKQVLDLRPTDRVFSIAKLYFAYGLGNAGYFPMSVGAQSVLHPGRPTPDLVFDVLTRHRPTVFFGVPTLYAALLAAKDLDRHDLSSLRLCVSAGEALPPELYHRWRDRFGVELLDGIGTTEILHIFLSNRPGAVRPGSTGRPVPGYEAVVVDDEGRPVPDGEIGNLRVRGDSTMAFYWNQHDKTRAALLGEWIQTGGQVLPGPRRLLLVLRPRRRHAEGRRHLGLAGRGREHAGRAPAGAGGSGGRPGGRRPPGQAQGVRRAQGPRPGVPGARRHAASLREGPHRPVQVPALDRVRARPPEDGDGQDPALPTPELVAAAPAA